jgi:hypothetical protein
MGRLVPGQRVEGRGVAWSYARRAVPPTRWPSAPHRGRVAAYISVVICLRGVALQPSTAPPDRAVFAFLRANTPLTDRDLAGLDRGAVIARTLPTDVPSEIVAVGAARFSVPAGYFIARFRDIVEFKRGAGVKQIGTFAEPPRPDDLGPLTIDEADLVALRTCRVGRCGLKLSTAMIEQVRHDIDWSAPAASQRARVLLKQMLLDRLSRYLAVGNVALEPSGDKSPRPGAVAPVGEVLRASRSLLGGVPELCRYLEEFPAADLPGSERFAYWSKESFGLKPVTSLTDVTIYRPPLQPKTTAFIVSKDLYSSHYVQTSLGVTLVVDSTSGGLPAAYVVYVNRSRIDALGGALSGLRRWIVERRIRSGTEEQFRLMKGRLERAYRAASW